MEACEQRQVLTDRQEEEWKQVIPHRDELIKQRPVRRESIVLVEQLIHHILTCLQCGFSKDGMPLHCHTRMNDHQKLNLVVYLGDGCWAPDLS